MNLATAFLVIISVVLVNNFIFSRFLGYCPYIGVSTEKKSALGMGLAVIFVMTLASVVCWIVYHFFLYSSIPPRAIFSTRSSETGKVLKILTSGTS